MFIDNWYQMSVDTVIKKLKTDREKGLNRKTVRALLRKEGKNEIYPVSKITFYNILKAMTMDYTSYLLIATALIAAVFEETVGAWTLVVLVAANLIATILAYTKSQKILEGMDRYTLPVVRVIRDGRLFMTEQKMLVQGDIICLSRGDIVPADARLISENDFTVDEEMLFGKGFSAQKKLSDIELHETLTPERQRNMVFASTVVLSGEARAAVTAVGEDTIVVLSEKNHPVISHEKIPVLGVLKKISRVWSLIILASVFLLTLLNFFMPGMEHSLFQSFIKSMSFAVSTMSEMYVAFGYIVLACAVFQTVQNFREAEAGAVIKNPLCMEKLRKVTCLVVPRDGIFTTRETVADRIFAGDRLCDIADRRCRRAMERPILFSILSTGLYGERFLKTADVRNIQTEEEASILSLARSMNIYNVRLDRAYPMLEHRSRDEESRYETTLVRHKDSLLAISRGETEELLSDCAYYYKDGKIMLLTQELRSAILISYRKLIRHAYSVTAVASRGTIYDNLHFIGAVQRDMVFEGFVAFRVPYQRSIGQLVSEAEHAGIKVIMTSERPAAAEVYFARQLGIVENRSQCADGAELHKMKEGIRRTNASYYRLYCGLDYGQKEELLEYLHEDGEVVGVVGHKLDDLPLLRRADVSIAQNIAVKPEGKLPGTEKETVLSRISESAAEDGCEALKFNADILVSDATHDGRGGFRGLLDAIGTAKNAERNIIRIARYLITTQTARFLLVLYTILFSQSGMSAVQILFSGMIADFFAVLILAFQKPEPDILEKKSEAVKWLEGILHTGIPAVLTGVCWACAGILTAFISGIAGLAQTELEYGSILFLTNSILSILLLLSVQRDEPIYRPGIRMSTMEVLYLLGYIELFLLFFLFPRFGTMFGVARFRLGAGGVIAALCILWLVAAECIKILGLLPNRTPMNTETEAAEERRAANFELFRLLKQQKEEEERAEMAQTEAAGEGKDSVIRKWKQFLFPKEEPSIQQADAETASAAEKNGAAPAGEMSLEEMQNYIRKRRIEEKKDREARRLEKEAADTSDVETAKNAKAGEAIKDEKKHSSLFRKLRRKESAQTHTQHYENPLFSEEDPIVEGKKEEDGGQENDVMYAALEEFRSYARSADEVIPQIPLVAPMSDEEELPFDDEMQESSSIGSELPDMAAFDAAVRSHEKNPYGYATITSLTIGHTGHIEETVEDVRSFLRADTQHGVSEEAADMEFSGIGYLFSDADYDAIIASLDDRNMTEAPEIDDDTFEDQ